MMGVSPQHGMDGDPSPAAAPVMPGGKSRTVPHFQFAARTGRVDWRRLAAVDVDRMAREMDVGVLQKLLQSVTFCNIESEDLSDVDPNIVKLFRLSQ